jgi:hypothetical protein
MLLKIIIILPGVVKQHVRFILTVLKRLLNKVSVTAPLFFYIFVLKFYKQE